jgi:long-chain acyl-CoA synthetase
MHPSHFAVTHPDRPAIIMADTGKTVTYVELDRKSNQIAHLLRGLGLVAGDVVAVMMENREDVFLVAWAAQRAGLYWTSIASKLVANEVEYILQDSGAKVLLASRQIAVVAAELHMRLSELPILLADGLGTSFPDLASAYREMPDTPIADESHGIDMLYSSGTTGRPKGIKPVLPGGPIDAESRLASLMQGFFGIQPGCTYLCPAPLYHAAPLRWSMNIHRLGGTVVVMERFDAENALSIIERYRIDAGQFVPTHFVRMLKLPDAERSRYDLSSLKVVVHAAAPCPLPVKQAMIDWWGPIVHEYYAGTEGNGLCAIKSADWLTHPGSVGRAVIGTARICDEDGEPLPPRAEGQIFFENGPTLAYHNDPEKTADSHNKYGWSSLGDVGWLDEDGYLYLTDRKSFMIISGGVNIYPQEIENLLVTHPKVSDVAVIGAPDADLGEKVVAVVEPADWHDAGPALADELLRFVRLSLSPIKTPKQVDFIKQLPRQPTGKLQKRSIRDTYWTNV